MIYIAVKLHIDQHVRLTIEFSLKSIILADLPELYESK